MLGLIDVPERMLRNLEPSLSGGVFGELSPHPEASPIGKVRVVLIGPECADPVRSAQSCRTLHPDAAVVIAAPDEAGAALIRYAAGFAAGLPPDLTILAGPTAEQLAAELESAATRVPIPRHDPSPHTRTHLELALSAAGIVLWTWDAGSDIFNATGPVSEVYGAVPPRSGQEFATLFVPEDRWPFLAALQQSSGEFEVRSRIQPESGGPVRWIVHRGHALFDTAGNRIGLTGGAWDATMQFQRDHDLSEVNSLLDSLLENAPVGFGFWDCDLRFVRVNRELARINGFGPEEHVGKTVADLLPGVEAGVTETFRHVLETGQPVLNREAQGSTASEPGVQRWWNLSYYPVRVDGRTVGIGAVCEEITARKRAEGERLELLERERVARRLAEKAERRAAFLAEAATVFASTPDFRTSLGRVARLAAPHVADWIAFDLLTPDRGQLDRAAGQHAGKCTPEMAALLDRVFSGREFPPFRQAIESHRPELEAVVEDGRHGLPRCSYMVVPLMDHGRPLGVLSFVRCGDDDPFLPADLRLAEELADRAGVALEVASLFATAERRRLEAEEAADKLRHANAELEEFAYVASHDLQEPLRTIASYTQLLERRYRGRLDHTADEFIDNIVGGATRLRNLIQDLLEYSRVSRQDTRPAGRVSLDAVLRDTLGALGASVEESGAVVSHDPLPELTGVARSHMDQLFQNLISNALKYRRADVPLRVHVSAARHGTHWEIAVRDNGQGFDPQFAERVFGIFKRLHGREVPGTGIGLALAKRIVERYGGRIWAEASPGNGAAFRFTLPG